MLKLKKSTALKMIAIICFIIFTSCKKDPAPDSISIGDESKMKIENINKAIYATEGENSSYSIDIDKDDLNDFEVIHGPTSTPNYPYVMHHWVSIKCLNETSYLLAEPGTDSIYHYYTYTYQNSGTPPVEEWKISNYACSKPDTITGTAVCENVIGLSDPGDVIQNDNNWQSTDFILYQEPYQMAYGGMTKPDTLVHFVDAYDYTCLNISNNVATYIPIKKIVDGEEKLGWISITLMNGTSLSINEFAIQK